MTIVTVEFNTKDIYFNEDGTERNATLEEVVSVFQQFSVAFGLPIKLGPTHSLKYWYCEFEVPQDRVEAFCTVIDWTTDFQATYN